MVADAMKQISAITGREYKPFTYYGDPDAENVIVAMGSVNETIKETIDYMRSKGEKAGLVTVHLYRPFSPKYLFDVLPASVKRICVLDRTKEPGANGEPLYLDIKEVFYGRENAPLIVGGRYGLSSKDTTPAQMLAVYENLKANEPKDHFTVGIVDDVTFTSLPVGPELHLDNADTFEARFIGLGADGTVGANKNSIKIMATRPTNTARPTSRTTRRNRAATRPRTCASATSRSARPIWSTRPTSWPATFRRIWASTTCSRDSRTEARSCSTACGTPRRPRSICPMR